MDNPDFLIVGGGTAGAVLAARLSEDPSTRVLLVEAGADTPPGAVPPDIADTFPRSTTNPDYFWPGLMATRAAGESARPFPQARVMGGGSSVTGLWALRGLPSDFDAWAARGATGWAWADVAGYFDRLENDSARSDGGTGPVPIRRNAPSEWPAFVGAIGRAAATRGLPHIDNINDGASDGFFAMPLFQDDGGRATSARCYLTAEVRRRGNLRILPETRAVAVRIEGSSVRKVTVENAAGPHDIVPRELVLSAGAIHSPALLMRAGIGAAGELSRLGVTPVLDRPGVGRNLQNHLYMFFALTLPRGARIAPGLQRFAFAGVRASSREPDCPEGDLLLFAIGRVSPRSFGPDLGMFGAALYAPFSRGRVSLVDGDVRTPPQVAFNMLSDPRDPPRLIKAARLAESLLADPQVAETYGDAFLLPPIMALNQFNRPGLRGSLLGLAAKAVLNAPAPIARALIARMIQPGRWFANRGRRMNIDDDELLAAPSPMAHPAGTCAMGGTDDPEAVVDPACRVRGIGNLRVVDASIMPRIPAANTNLPTLMLAERAADLIRNG